MSNLHNMNIKFKINKLFTRINPAEKIISKLEDRSEGLIKDVAAQKTKKENSKEKLSHKKCGFKTCLLRVTEKEQRDRLKAILKKMLRIFYN